MSADKLALPVQAVMTNSGSEATLRDADRSYLGCVTTFSPTIPADIALRAAEAAAAVINEALTPAWTWGPWPPYPDLRHLFYRGKVHQTVRGTDTMAQAMCDGLNAAGVQP